MPEDAPAQGAVMESVGVPKFENEPTDTACPLGELVRL